MSGTCGKCDTTFFPPLRPVNTATEILQDLTGASANLPNQNANYSRLNEIEQSLYGRNFYGQNLTSRLSRIEKTLFNTTFPSSNNLQRIDNVISNYNQIVKYPNLSNNVLSKMERQIFNQAYPQYNAQKRLERLEQQILGATQSGDINTRYENLKVAARNYRPQEYYQNPVAPLNSSKAGRILGVLGGLGNMGGAMTGFTPPIGPYSGYGYNNYGNVINPYTYNNAYNNYSNPGGFRSSQSMRSPFGFYDRTNEFSTNTGTGVTILD